jgi:hypothetical protein
VLVNIGLLERFETRGPDDSLPFDRSPGSKLRRSKLLRGLLRLEFNLPGSGLRFGLPD